MTLQIVVPGVFTATGLPDLGLLGFTDTFDRPDADVLGATQRPRRPWTVWASAATAEGIQNGEAIFGRTARGPSAAVADARTSDGTVEVTLGEISDGQSGVVFRAASNGNYWSFRQTGSSYSLYLMVGNSATNVASASGVTPAIGDTIRVTLDGPSIVVHVNGAEVLTHSATDYQDATYHGFYNAGTPGVNTFRSITVTA